MSIKTTAINFSLNQKPIDYFQLKEKYFKPFNKVSKNIITTSKPYIEITDLSNFNLTQKETVVFNFPVGKGKTTLCYDLIEKYDKMGWYVIVCSPFVKLVEKDYNNVENRVGLPPEPVMGMYLKPLKVCNYFGLAENLSFVEERYSNYANSCNIHVMTLNCLLGNPGDNALEQGINKSIVSVPKSQAV